MAVGARALATRQQQHLRADGCFKWQFAHLHAQLQDGCKHMQRNCHVCCGASGCHTCLLAGCLHQLLLFVGC